ncbi:Gamma-interferon-inducible lysosomal thiol reductase, partial [Durusdinium trenchii]
NADRRDSRPFAPLPMELERRKEAWDFARELRALRESTARGRTEELQALRRNNEEVERCVLRRQMDESAALQDFLGGLHEEMGRSLERLNTECARRWTSLEERVAKTEE